MKQESTRVDARTADPQTGRKCGMRLRLADRAGRVFRGNEYDAQLRRGAVGEHLLRAREGERLTRSDLRYVAFCPTPRTRTTHIMLLGSVGIEPSARHDAPILDERPNDTQNFGLYSDHRALPPARWPVNAGLFLDRAEERPCSGEMIVRNSIKCASLFCWVADFLESTLSMRYYARTMLVNNFKMIGNAGVRSWRRHSPTSSSEARKCSQASSTAGPSPSAAEGIPVRSSPRAG